MTLYYRKEIPKQINKEVTEMPTNKELLEQAGKLKLAGIMAHRDWMNKSQLKTYHGFKRWHRYEGRNDNEALNNIDRYIIDYYNEMPIIDTNAMHQIGETIPEILSNWIMFENYVCTELTKIVNMLESNEAIMDADFIRCYNHKVHKEIKRITKITKQLESANYDPVEISAISRMLHEKYKKKESKKQKIIID